VTSRVMVPAVAAGISGCAQAFTSVRPGNQRRCIVQKNLPIEQPSERVSTRPQARDLALANVMPIGAKRQPFDSLTLCLHWATALLVLGMFVSAWLHALAEARESVYAAAFIQVHRSLGATIWIATAFRLFWRLTNAELPPFPVHITKVHRAIVQMSEYILYALLLVQPATGLGMALFNGRAFALFLWRVPQLLHQNKAMSAAFHSAHEIGAWTLAALATVHALAALFHHFVLRDDVLHCMAPVIPTAPRKPRFSFGQFFGGRSMEAQGTPAGE
jgi:cytochrome b561